MLKPSLLVLLQFTAFSFSNFLTSDIVELTDENSSNILGNNLELILIFYHNTLSTRSWILAAEYAQVAARFRESGIVFTSVNCDETNTKSISLCGNLDLSNDLHFRLPRLRVLKYGQEQKVGKIFSAIEISKLIYQILGKPIIGQLKRKDIKETTDSIHVTFREKSKAFEEFKKFAENYSPLYKFSYDFDSELLHDCRVEKIENGKISEKALEQYSDSMINAYLKSTLVRKVTTIWPSEIKITGFPITIILHENPEQFISVANKQHESTNFALGDRRWYWYTLNQFGLLEDRNSENPTVLYSEMRNSIENNSKEK